jgi:hypothetical protein
MTNTYDAYKLINLDDFNNLDLTSRKLTVLLGVLGEKEILVTKGNNISILYDDVFLSVDLNEKNPFEFENYSVFLDPNNDIWLGIKVES